MKDALIIASEDTDGVIHGFDAYSITVIHRGVAYQLFRDNHDELVFQAPLSTSLAVLPRAANSFAIREVPAIPS
jgi:hypothetical protein